MARIRTIKPEFFTSADIVRMSPLSRLFYASLWCEADREGRLKWDTRTLKLRYFPADDCDIESMANELLSSGLIDVYEVDGKEYAEIPSFKNHQVINNREAESAIPPRVKEASRRVQVEGKEGGEGNGRDSAEPQSDSTPENSVIQIPLVDQTEFGITEKHIAEWSESFPAVDVLQQLRSMRQWCLANPTRRKTKRGVSAFIVSWLTKEQDKGRSYAKPTQSGMFAGAI